MKPTENIPDEIKSHIINYLNGNWSDCDSSKLTNWVNKKEENKILFQQLVDVWEMDYILKNEKHFQPSNTWKRLERKLHRSKRMEKANFFTKEIVKYAAIFVIAFVIGVVGKSMLSKKSFDEPLSKNVIEYTVPYGSKTSLKLMDGTKVQLNAGTTIKYASSFGITNRNLEISGEAFFDVAKNKDLPFVVIAKNISVKALGTKFNVKAYPEEDVIETILQEGSVKIFHTGNERRSDIILKPSEKMVYEVQEKEYQLYEGTDMSEISWFRDEWIIRNMKMSEFVKLLGRRYNIKFNITDQRIKEYEFGGIIKEETIEQVLHAISLSAPIDYKIQSNQTILSINEEKIKQYNSILRSK